MVRTQEPTAPSVALPFFNPPLTKDTPIRLRVQAAMVFCADGEANIYLIDKRCLVAFHISLATEPPQDAGLVIWLQNVETMEQWQSSRLRACDFETAGSFLPNATLEDYAQLFANDIRTFSSYGDWSRSTDSITDRVLELTMNGGHYFRLKLKPIVSDSESVHAQAYGLLLAHARELEKSLYRLKQARQATESVSVATDGVVPTPASASLAPVESLDTTTGVETCARADIGFVRLSQTLCLTRIPTGAVAVAEFQDGAKIVFRKNGKFLISISIGFFTNDITVPKGSPLYELQDTEGKTLAVNLPTSGCGSTHMVQLIYSAEVSEGEAMVLRAKNPDMIGGSVMIQTL